MTTDGPRGLWYWTAVGGGLGLAPRAPGTFGSIPGSFLGAIFAWQTSSLPWSLRLAAGLALISALIAISLWSINRYEQHTGIHDDSRIVIDEIAGQCIATMWLPIGWLSLALSFVLFRFFDIVKKGPVGYIDQHVAGAWGTLGDDLVAGVLAGLVGLGIMWL